MGERADRPAGRVNRRAHAIEHRPQRDDPQTAQLGLLPALLPETAETANRSLEEIIAWIHDHPEADLSIESLAALAHMSVRNFARRFREETGVTPAKYVERIRLAAARSRLENSLASIESVAASAGFINTERMRRTFMRHLKISPQDYRRRFQL